MDRGGSLVLSSRDLGGHTDLYREAREVVLSLSMPWSRQQRGTLWPPGLVISAAVTEDHGRRGLVSKGSSLGSKLEAMGWNGQSGNSRFPVYRGSFKVMCPAMRLSHDSVTSFWS